MARTVQIRDLNEDVYRVLRSRAAGEGLPLAAYLRQVLAREAGTPTMAELLERADRRRARDGGADRASAEAAFEGDRADHR